MIGKSTTNFGDDTRGEAKSISEGTAIKRGNDVGEVLRASRKPLNARVK